MDGAEPKPYESDLNLNKNESNSVCQFRDNSHSHLWNRLRQLPDKKVQGSGERSLLLHMDMAMHGSPGFYKSGTIKNRHVISHDLRVNYLTNVRLGETWVKKIQSFACRLH